jgi:hypothetical protein
MIKWISAVIVIVALLVVGDVAARKYAERQVAHDIVTHEKGATAKVKIASFPFVGRLGVSREVEKITADVRNVPVTTPIGNFKLDEVDLTLKGVKVRLGPLTAGSDGAVKSIKSGTVRARMSEASLAQLVNLPITLGNGSAQVTVAGIKVNGSVTLINSNVLHLSGAGLTLDVPLGEIPVLPCIANVVITPGQLVMSCSFNKVPAALLEAATSG